jgi:hypothetical protein
VFGTVGNGYEGVRRAGWPAGVGGMLPRMVRADSVDWVDSVDSVDAVKPVARGLGLGLMKAPSSVGDKTDEDDSSLMGEGRRGAGEA